MSSSRRQFLASSSLAALAAAFESSSLRAQAAPGSQVPPNQQPTPGPPSAFSNGSVAGPIVTSDDFAHAEKLVQFEMTEAERDEAAVNWRAQMAPLYELRTGPRKLEFPQSVAPATVWNPMLPGLQLHEGNGTFVRSADAGRALPTSDEEIAYAPVTLLSQWIHAKAITSERLTNIYLARLERFNPTLRCVITFTRDHALEQARQADKEIAAGHYRGPLHGIPWGAKDLLDTAGIPTTYGAEPYRDRVPQRDAAVVSRLNAAGAVLVAKLSLGALALNDVWFGGQTMNPWIPDAEGASGSSAGPGAATAAGLVGFAIGSETGGSIVSPSMRNGVTGLRPTYGRVARTGAMTLCWSLDKLGPMTRSVEDAMLVLRTISGPDPGDIASLPSTVTFRAGASVKGLRVGYFPQWMKEPPATDVDRHALDVARTLGMNLVEVSIPDWPYDSLNLMLFAEGAAAFDDLVLAHKLHELKMQVPDAWPNVFRQSRFLSAVDFVQADRFRRKVAEEMARVMAQVDVLLVPSLRDEMLVITNNTGHPSLTLRAGFVEVSEARSDWAPDPAHPVAKFNPPRRVPHGVTLIGRLFDEGTMAQAGMALEKAFNVMGEHPLGF